MKKSRISIPWKEGLHLRPAATIVQCAKAFQSSIRLRLNDSLADARSIFAILILAAGCGAVIDIEVNGADEAEAHAALTAIFEVSDDGGMESTGEFVEDNLKS